MLLSAMPDLAPIAVFVYNRPKQAERALASLAAGPLAIVSDLVVYSDGPKNRDHESAVQATRDVVRRAQGFKSVRIVERDRNLGLAESIMTGVDEACDTAGRVIVVEDDLVLSPDFLAFMNSSLDHFALSDRVLQVSGYSYPVDTAGLPDAYFLPMVSCWGWGTWQRGWSKFDRDMTALRALDLDGAARARFNIDGVYDYYGMACDERAGRIDSWGVRWQLSLFANDGVVLYPRRSLVYNSGTDASGTHGAGHSAFQDLGAVRASSAVDQWPEPTVDETALGRVKELLAPHRPSRLRRLVQRIRL